MRKGLYYLGISLIAIGIVAFLTVFADMFRSMGTLGGPADFGTAVQTMGFRSIGGILLAALGSILMRIGARGAAGAGVVLNPRQARKDLEPWSRMAGGMASDAIDEAGIKVAGEGQLQFDEKMRRLNQLRKDGLITEDEYEEKRKEFLAEDW